MSTMSSLQPISAGRRRTDLLMRSILLGLTRAVQICPLGANVSKILQMATVCAYDRPLVEIAE